RHDGAHFPGAVQERHRLRSLEAHIDQATELILAPGVRVKHQQVPAALGHQGDKLLLPVSIQHQGDTDSRNHSVGSSRPNPSARARFMTAAPTAANWMPDPVLLL